MAGMFDFFWEPDQGVDVNDIRDLVPFCVEKVPNADPNEVRRALAHAAGRFLSVTGCWEREVPCVARDGEVVVGSGGCARVRAVKYVRRTDSDIPSYSSVSPWQTLDAPAREDTNGVFIVTLPEAVEGDAYTAGVVLTTRLGSELCPVWVMERYGEAIAAQAAHNIAMKGQAGVTAMSIMFQEAVQDAIARKACGGSVLTSGASSAISGSIERI